MKTKFVPHYIDMKFNFKFTTFGQIKILTCSFICHGYDTRCLSTHLPRVKRTDPHCHLNRRHDGLSSVSSLNKMMSITFIFTLDPLSTIDVLQ